MPRRGSPYGGEYLTQRRAVLGLACSLQILCRGAPATSADHDPPLSRHLHVPGSGCCVLRPACRPCQAEQGARLASGVYVWKSRRELPEPSRDW